MRRWTDFLEQMKYSFEQQCNRFHDLPVSDFLGPDEPDDLGPYCFMMSNRFSISSWKIQYDLTMKFHQRFLETKSQSFEWLVRSGVDNSNLRRARKIEFKQRPKCFYPFRCYIKQTSWADEILGFAGPIRSFRGPHLAGGPYVVHPWVRLWQRLMRDLESSFVGFRFPPDDAPIEETRGESFEKFESTKKPDKSNLFGQLGC